VIAVLGTISNLEQEVSAVGDAARRSTEVSVRTAAVKHADETRWKLGGKLLAVGGGQWYVPRL
jgi:hypothetical protein